MGNCGFLAEASCVKRIKYRWVYGYGSWILDPATSWYSFRRVLQWMNAVSVGVVCEVQIIILLIDWRICLVER